MAFMNVFCVIWVCICNLIYSQATIDQGWTLVNKKAAFSRRASPHGVNVNGTFIVTGGRNGTETMHNDVWLSNDKGISWELVVAHAPWEPRAYHFSLYLNNYLYVIGGQGGDGFSDFFDDIWRSNDFGKTWELVVEHAPFGKRAGGYGFVYDNKMYILAGAYCKAIDFPCNLDSKRIYFDDVWTSNDGINWIQITKGIEFLKREGVIIVIKDDIFYAFGGDNGINGPYFNDVWKSNDTGITWYLINNNAQWSKRTGHVGVLYNDNIIMFGGYPDLTDMWSSMDGITWTLVTNHCWNCNSTNNDCGKFDFEFFVDNTDGISRIYTIAGDQEVKAPIPQDNDIWYYYNASMDRS